MKMKLFAVLFIVPYWLWTQQMGKCVIDMNMNHFQYLSDNLKPEECRQLVASLHFGSFDLPNALRQAERKVPKDESCLAQLLHWNAEIKGKRSTTHEVIARRLKQINRSDLSLWLANATSEAAHKALEAFDSGETFRMYQPIVLPYVNYSTEASSPSSLRITTPEIFIRVVKQNPVDPSEDIVIDPTEWTIFDTISWSIVIILFILIVVLLVFLIMSSPCNKRKRRCQCSQPASPQLSYKSARPSSRRSSPCPYRYPATPQPIYKETYARKKPSYVKNYSTGGSVEGLSKPGGGDGGGGGYCCKCCSGGCVGRCKRECHRECKRPAPFSDTQSYNATVGSYDCCDGCRSPRLTPPAPRPICTMHNDSHSYPSGGGLRTIDIHQKIAIPMHGENSD